MKAAKPSAGLRKPQAEERSYAPFDVVHGKAFLVADVGEIIYHRQPQKFVAPLIYCGSTTGDDNFWEVVFQRNLRVVEGHRRVAIDDERG